MVLSDVGAQSIDCKYLVHFFYKFCQLLVYKKYQVLLLFIE